MGLDAVEIIMRAEEFYSITFTDYEAAQVRTVGDFYLLICSKLDLIPLRDPQNPATIPTIAAYERSFLILRKRTPLRPSSELLPWTSQSVWDALVAILVDQQGLESKEILYMARFCEDLGVD